MRGEIENRTRILIWRVPGPWPDVSYRAYKIAMRAGCTPAEHQGILRIECGGFEVTVKRLASVACYSCKGTSKATIVSIKGPALATEALGRALQHPEDTLEYRLAVEALRDLATRWGGNGYTVVSVKARVCKPREGDWRIRVDEEGATDPGERVVIAVLNPPAGPQRREWIEKRNGTLVKCREAPLDLLVLREPRPTGEILAYLRLLGYDVREVRIGG